MTEAESSLRIAQTPRPPYYSVTTTTELLVQFDQDAHMRWGRELYVKAGEIPGFLGLEVGYFSRFSIAVSYWTDLAAIERWRAHPAHRAAKAKAKADWFGPTITRIALVENDYGFGMPEP